MITVLLWILAAAAIFLIFALAAPIRLGVNAEYRQNKPFMYEYWGSYIHPIAFRYTRSSKNRAGETRIFGIRLRKKNDADFDDGDDNLFDDDDANRKIVADKNAAVKNVADNNIILQKAVKNNAASPKTARDNIAVKKNFTSRIKNRIKNIKSSNFYKILRDKPLRGKLTKWLLRVPKRLLALARFDEFKLRATIGGQDPAATGKLYGYFCAAKSAITPMGGLIDISMEPAFTGERFEIDAKITAKTTVGAVLRQVSAALITFPYLRMSKVTGTQKEKTKKTLPQ